MIRNLFIRIIILILSAYKVFISPILPNSCRFYPSCSQYFKDCVNHYGILKGSLLGFKRIIRCHPLCSGGYDPAVKNTCD